MVLEVGGKGGGWLQNHEKCMDCNHFHAFGSEWEGGDWLQNHKKRTGQSAFSRFGNGREGGGLPQNHKKYVFYHFRGFESAREGGVWL